MLADACEQYTNQLDTVFAAPKDRFRNSEFRVQTDALDNILNKQYQETIEFHKMPTFHAFKKKGSEELIVQRSMSMVQGKEVGALAVKMQFVLLSATLFFPTLFLTLLSPQLSALGLLFFGRPRFCCSEPSI